MANNLVIILPDGQRLQAGLLPQYSATSTAFTWTYANASTGTFTQYGTSLVNYKQLMLTIDNAINQGVTGTVPYSSLMAYTLSTLAPDPTSASVVHGGTTQSVLIYGTNFNQSMVGHFIYFNASTANFGTAAMKFTVEEAGSNWLDAGWTSDGDGSCTGTTCYAFFVDGSGIYYGLVNNISVT